MNFLLIVAVLLTLGSQLAASDDICVDFTQDGLRVTAVCNTSPARQIPQEIVKLDRFWAKIFSQTFLNMMIGSPSKRTHFMLSLQIFYSDLGKFKLQYGELEKRFPGFTRSGSKWANNALTLIDSIFKAGDNQFSVEQSEGKVMSELPIDVNLSEAVQLVKLLSRVVGESPTGLEIDWTNLWINDKSLLQYATEIYKEFGYDSRLSYLKPYFRIIGEYLAGKISYLNALVRVKEECIDYQPVIFHYITSPFIV